MTDHKPVLQMYGPLHALSCRGLHVRQSTRAWKLIRPLQPELLTVVQRACSQLSAAEAAYLLLLLDPRLRAAEAPPAQHEVACTASVAGAG